MFTEITELEILLGSLALYLEDAYVSSILDLSRLAIPTVSADTDQIPEERSLLRPLRLKLLYIHPLNLTLTLHTAVSTFNIKSYVYFHNIFINFYNI